LALTLLLPLCTHAAAVEPGQPWPALREHPFDVGVSRHEALLADWPRQQDAVTLIALAGGRVLDVQYAHSESELRMALGLKP